MKVAINGFGRIGRSVFRVGIEKGVNIIAINDTHGIKDAAYLLKYDSVYGKYNKNIRIDGNYLIVGGKRIKVISERDPSKLPWKALGVDVVVESTGVFKERNDLIKHLKSGAKHVIITTPSDGVEI